MQDRLVDDTDAWKINTMTSRTVSPSAATSRAIAGTVVPDAKAIMINARHPQCDSCPPRRTSRNRYRPRQPSTWASLAPNPVGLYSSYVVGRVVWVRPAGLVQVITPGRACSRFHPGACLHR